MQRILCLVGAVGLIAGCSTYQAPPVDHPSAPGAFRNTRMPDPPAVAKLPARKGQELFVVLPGPDGKVGAIFIEKQGQRVVLDQAFGASQITGGGAPQQVQLSEDEVKRQFGAALQAVPARPTSFVLYFVSARDDLTEESQASLRQMLAEVRSRPLPDVVVIGHTDTTGTVEANDALSLQRAERVKALIAQTGIDARRIQTAGRDRKSVV